MSKKRKKLSKEPSMTDIQEPVEVKPERISVPEALTCNLPEEARTTVVHCYIKPGLMRIWPTTFLVDEENNKKYKLISAINISLYPDWDFLPEGEECFTLVFEGLHRDCNEFRLIEEIPEPGEFRSKVIYRNRTDVYRLEL